MAKLYFRYGAMGSSKTANALMVRYNYLEKGKKAVILKPGFENRDGANVVSSRIGIQATCDDSVEHFLETWKADSSSVDGIDAIIIDEAQFLSADCIDALSDIVDLKNIPVLCYGLRTDFTSTLFEGAKRLMELADKIEEIPTVCWCGKRAHYNARISNGHIVRSGAQVLLGGNDSYIALCRRHFKSGQIRPNSQGDHPVDSAE